MGYEIQFAAGTFNAKDWIDKAKAPGLISLDNPSVSPSKKTFKEYTSPTLHLRLCRSKSERSGAGHQLAAWELAPCPVVVRPEAPRRRDAECVAPAVFVLNECLPAA